MSAKENLTLFYAPNTRASGTLALLQELEVPYQLKVFNVKTGEHRQPSYLSINPMGKVPAILHNDELVTEQGAIFAYLPDAFPAKKLSPAIGDRKRGPFLRWLAFYGSSFEPALIDKAMKREPGSRAMMPYGDYDTMLNTLISQLEKGPYILGDQMTAADILWGMALKWTTDFKLVPEHPVLRKYIDHMKARPSFQFVKQTDEKLSAEYQAGQNI